MQTLQSIPSLLRASEHRIDTIRRFLFGSRHQMVLPQPLPRPHEIRDRPHLVRRRYDGIVVLRQTAIFKSLDTPTASLYRMCEFLCADESDELMLEMQYFWNNSSTSWRLEAVPDPCDHDQQRYVVFASMVESLVRAFNYRLSLGLQRGAGEQREEKCPPWTRRVPALKSRLDLRGDRDIAFPEPGPDPFSNRGVDANAGNLYSI